MDKATYDLVVIGSGPAGQKGAIAAAKLGKRVAVEEKIPYEVGVARYEELARGQILGDQTGKLKLLFDPRSLKLLGIHIITSVYGKSGSENQ